MEVVLRLWVVPAVVVLLAACTLSSHAQGKQPGIHRDGAGNLHLNATRTLINGVDMVARLVALEARLDTLQGAGSSSSTGAPTAAPTDSPTDAPTDAPTTPRPTSPPTTAAPTRDCPRTPPAFVAGSTTSDRSVSCGQALSCNSAAHTVALNEHLRITCSGQSSCTDMVVQVAARTRLTLTCSGISSCTNVRVQGDQATVHIHGNNNAAANGVAVVGDGLVLSTNCDVASSCQNMRFQTQNSQTSINCSGQSSCTSTTFSTFDQTSVQLTCSGLLSCGSMALESTPGGRITFAVAAAGSSGFSSGTICRGDCYGC